jgi:hypothetical protein
MSQTISNLSSGLSGTLSSFSNENPRGYTVLLAICAFFGVIVLVAILKRIYRQFKLYFGSRKWILDGTKSAKKGKVISQDPSKIDSITLGRSDNEVGGLEFSYSFWLYIDDWAYKYGEWKHVMHKGNDSSWPNRAPGIWLHPKENAMRVYMNTFKKIGEYVDVENIPLNKWIYIVVAVRQKDLDIYINGNLAKRKNLDSLPKQNYGDLYLNSFRGFSGYLSNIMYYDYYLSFSEMDSILNKGPSTKPVEDTLETPPYFSPNWWANTK